MFFSDKLVMFFSDKLVMFISAILSMLFMILAVKYLYAEKCFTQRKSWTSYGVIYLSAEAGAMLLQGDLYEVAVPLILLIAFSLMICISRKKRRLRGLFLFYLLWELLCQLK